MEKVYFTVFALEQYHPPTESAMVTKKNTLELDVTGIDPTHRPLARAIAEAAIAAAVAHSGVTPEPEVHGWTQELAREFDRRLRARRWAQRADVVHALAAAGGNLDRTEVYTMCGYGPDHKMNGFTKPAKGVLRRMIAEGLLPAKADDDESKSNPLRPTYPTGVLTRATGFHMEPELAEIFTAALGED